MKTGKVDIKAATLIAKPCNESESERRKVSEAMCETETIQQNQKNGRRTHFKGNVETLPSTKGLGY